MNELFASMKEQLDPSLPAQAELQEALSRPVKAKRPVRWTALAAAAACLTLALCAIPAGQSGPAPKQHSYTTTDQPFSSLESQKQPISGDTGTGGSDALPGGAYIGDVPVQQGAELYDHLLRGMGLWGEADPDWPDWYGGAYVDARGGLTVLLVESQNPGDKSLELQVLEWTGNTGVAFSSAKYSLAHLHELRQSVTALMDGWQEGYASWAVNEVENRIDLDVSAPLPAELLEKLAQLDPEDDAISVRVCEGSVLDLQQKGPAPGGVTTPTEQPVPVIIGDDVDGDPGGYVRDGDPVELPIPEPVDGEAEPAHYDILPLD